MLPEAAAPATLSEKLPETGRRRSTYLLCLALELRRLAASPRFGFAGEFRSLTATQSAGLLLLDKFNCMSARKPPHLLETFDGHQRRQRLALAFDDELVVPQSNPI
jgi:hypothetical protein